jgi:hypothetical protein
VLAKTLARLVIYSWFKFWVEVLILAVSVVAWRIILASLAVVVVIIWASAATVLASLAVYFDSCAQTCVKNYALLGLGIGFLIRFMCICMVLFGFGKVLGQFESSFWLLQVLLSLTLAWKWVVLSMRTWIAILLVKIRCN